MDMQTLDPEAFQEEHAEEQIARENAFIDDVEEQIKVERLKGDKAKYARLARRHLPGLREIFKSGHEKRRAQLVIEDLCLLATVPLEDLEKPFIEIDGEYIEVDPYTGLPYDSEDEEKRQDTMVLDGNEVRVAAKMTQDPDDAGDALGAAVYLANRTTEAEVITLPKTSLSARIVQELKGMGYKAKVIGQVLENTFSFVDTEQVFYDDDRVDEATMRLAVPAMSEDSFKHEEVSEIKGMLGDALRLHKAAMNEAFTLLRRKRVKFKKPDMLVARWQTASGKELNDLLYKIGFESRLQSLAVAAMSHEKYETILPDIPIPVYGSLDTFIELFGDDLLDEAFFSLESKGEYIGDKPWAYATSEEIEDADPRIDKAAQTFEREIIDTFADDCENIELTKAYARGVFAAVANGEADLATAGYSNYFYEKNPLGHPAFVRAWEKYKNDELESRVRKARRAFYKTGKIIALSAFGPTIQAIDGKVEKVNWNIARWKMQEGELPLTGEERKKLKDILRRNRWGASVQQLL